MDAEVWRLNGRKGSPGKNWDKRGSTGTANDRGGFAGERLGSKGNPNKMLPASEESRRWSGWGTALKPAHEPICLARKPLSEKTVAANVLKWGTGAINIESSRIHADDDEYARNCSGDRGHVGTRSEGVSTSMRPGGGAASPGGRFPANTLFDEEAGKALDEQSGTIKSGANPTRRNSDIFRDVYGEFKGNRECIPARGADFGGASRFFYCAKASRKERGAGNTHPTVKPIKLIQYLVRLVTPPGGDILDPFLGSGTTALACAGLGITCVGIEKDAESVAIAKARTESLLNEPEH